MKKLLIVSLFLITNILFSQNPKESIELPKVVSEIEFSKNYITAILDFYLNKNGTVFIKDSLININSIGFLSMKFKRNHQPFHKYIYLASLSIDKNTPYKYVDSVKTQLEKSSLNYYYRTNNKEDISQGFYNILRKPTLFNIRILNDSIKSIPYEFADYQESDLIHGFLDNLYSHRYQKAKLILRKLNYIKIKFLKNNYVRINDDKKVKITSKEFETEVTKSDICFSVYTPNLIYKEYLNNVNLLYKLIKKNRDKEIKSPYFFEVSKEINAVLINEIKI